MVLGHIKWWEVREWAKSVVCETMPTLILCTIQLASTVSTAGALANQWYTVYIIYND